MNPSKQLPPEGALLLTIPEAARLLRLTVSTLRSWRLAGKFLRFCKIGGKVLILRSDLMQFIDASGK